MTEKFTKPPQRFEPFGYLDQALPTNMFGFLLDIDSPTGPQAINPTVFEEYENKLAFERNEVEGEIRQQPPGYPNSSLETHRNAIKEKQGMLRELLVAQSVVGVITDADLLTHRNELEIQLDEFRKQRGYSRATPEEWELNQRIEVVDYILGSARQFNQ